MNFKWYFERGSWNLLSIPFLLINIVATLLVGYFGFFISNQISSLIIAKYGFLVGGFLLFLALLPMLPAITYTYLIYKVPSFFTKYTKFKALLLIVGLNVIANVGSDLGIYVRQFYASKSPCIAYELGLDEFKSKCKKLINESAVNEKENELTNSIILNLETSKEYEFIILDSNEWSRLSKKQKSIYKNALLESIIFFTYSSLEKSNLKNQQNFSDLQLCFSSIYKEDFYPKKWLLSEMLDKSAAYHFYIESSIICKPYIGKGELNWSPKKFITNNEWNEYTDEDKSIYVIAYLESAYEHSKNSGNEILTKRLKDCLIGKKISEFIIHLKSLDLPDELPLPWSISEIVGSICKR